MHKTNVVEKKVTSDGAIAVRVRCCGDEATDSVATVYVNPNTTEDQIKDAVAAHHTRVSNQHDAMQRASKLIDAI